MAEGTGQITDPRKSAIFLTFPPRAEVLAKLRGIEGYEPDLDPLVAAVTDRLAGGSYEASAFVFILIELVYDFEVSTFQNLAFLLPRTVQALTGDPFLAGYAHDAYREIKESIEGVIDETPTQKVATAADGNGRVVAAPAPGPPPARVEPAVPPPRPQPAAPAVEAPVDPAVAAARDELMAELQSAQKRLNDLGLGTRLSIETALARPSGANVSRTLKEVLVLRGHLRRFEELLSRAEEQILDAAGDDGGPEPS